MPSRYGKRQDLCPVCCQSYPQEGRIYCSDKCIRTAYNFRRRCDGAIKTLRALGFKCTWNEGVQLQIYIPDGLTWFYPRFCHQFTWPDNCVDIETVSVPSLWRYIEKWLGKLMTDYLFALGRSEGLLSLPCEVTYKQFARSLAEGMFTSFECSSCNKRYITSEYGGESRTTICMTCAIESIPF